MNKNDYLFYYLAYADSRFNRTVDMKTGYRTRNILCVPMRNATGEILGVTQVINKLPDSSTFNKEDEQQLYSFSALGIASDFTYAIRTS